MKTFNQTITDLTTEIDDDSAATQTYLKMKVNQCIHNVFAMRDWSFNHVTKTLDTVADQQAYSTAYNVLKLDWVTVTISTTIYKPTEIKTTEEWKVLNRNVVGSDIPQFWYFNTSTKKVELYPIPSSASNTITYGFTKKHRDLAIDDYTTGTITTIADSTVFTGAGTTFTAAMVGRHIKVTDTGSIIGGFWFEIDTFTSTTVIGTKETAPVAVTGKNITIAEMIPFPDGFENIPYFYAAWQYYKKKEKFKNTAADFKLDYEDAVDDMLRRDSKTVNDLMVQDAIQVVDVNRDPWSLELS